MRPADTAADVTPRVYLPDQIHTSFSSLLVLSLCDYMPELNLSSSLLLSLCPDQMPEASLSRVGYGMQGFPF